MSNNPLFRLVHLGKRFTKGKDTIAIFDGLDHVDPGGDFVAMMGPSGSGKTTLLNLIGGIDRRMRVRSVSPGSASTAVRRRARQMARRERRLRVPVLQSDADADGAQNVELPLLLTEPRKAERARARRDRAQRSSIWPTGTALSARDVRRPATARGDRARDRLRPEACCSATSRPATSTAPRPTRFWSMLQMLNRDLGKTVVMVTHDPAAARYAQAHAASRQGPVHREGARRVNDFFLIRKNLFRKKLRAWLMIGSI